MPKSYGSSSAIGVITYLYRETSVAGSGALGVAFWEGLGSRGSAVTVGSKVGATVGRFNGRLDGKLNGRLDGMFNGSRDGRSECMINYLIKNAKLSHRFATVFLLPKDSRLSLLPLKSNLKMLIDENIIIKNKVLLYPFLLKLVLFLLAENPHVD
ncbi:hypothetical protein BC829DRAFT_407335 [Chytridium lagenaria]|nr:hypothetical protein BC829DRAFT_407335 [Chytridium lagenaria]